MPRFSLLLSITFSFHLFLRYAIDLFLIISFSIIISADITPGSLRFFDAFHYVFHAGFFHFSLRLMFSASLFLRRRLIILLIIVGFRFFFFQPISPFRQEAKYFIFFISISIFQNWFSFDWLRCFFLRHRCRLLFDFSFFLRWYFSLRYAVVFFGGIFRR